MIVCAVAFILIGLTDIFPFIQKKQQQTHLFLADLHVGLPFVSISFLFLFFWSCIEDALL